MVSIANPLRFPGLARIAAGGWFIAAGVTTLRQYHDLLPMAQRIFYGEMGKTDAPIRSLLALVLAGALVLIGPVLMAMGFRWMRRLPLPPGGPAAIAQEEVIAALVRREPTAFAEGPTKPHWPIRSGLADQLPDITWWRRDLMSRGTRAFFRACGFVMVLGVLYFVMPYLTYLDLLGPFPATFVLVLLFVTGTWAALGLMLIPSDVPRIESFEIPLSLRSGAASGPVIESSPEMLDRESPWLGLTLAFFGVAVQCLTVSWWTLSFIGYPVIATSIIRHTGSIAGGLVFLFMGGRMLTSAADILQTFRYGSTLIYIEHSAATNVGYAALVRTESRGLTGPRHVVSAVVSVHVREMVEALLQSRLA